MIRQLLFGCSGNGFVALDPIDDHFANLFARSINTALHAIVICRETKFFGLAKVAARENEDPEPLICSSGN
jgi:hypothetical protein